MIGNLASWLRDWTDGFAELGGGIKGLFDGKGFVNGSIEARRAYRGALDPFANSEQDNASDAGSAMLEAAQSGRWDVFLGNLVGKQGGYKVFTMFGLSPDVANKLGDFFSQMFIQWFGALAPNEGSSRDASLPQVTSVAPAAQEAHPYTPNDRGAVRTPPSVRASREVSLAELGQLTPETVSNTAAHDDRLHSPARS